MRVESGVGALGSLLVHLVLLWALTWQPRPPAVPPVKVRASMEVAMRLLAVESDGDHAGSGCPLSYRGIGIEQTPTGMVIEVLRGSPAERAGIQLGDVIHNHYATLIRDRYPIGHVLRLNIRRLGELVDVPVRIEKICYELVEE